MSYVEAVRRALESGGDPERAFQQQRYMKSELPYRGFSSPELRALLGPLIKNHTFSSREEWESAARDLWDEATHREEWYAAIALLRHSAYSSWRDPDLLPLLRHLIEVGAWWDVVDEIAQHLVGGVLSKHRTLLTPTMRHWALDDHLWVRRTAVISQNRHKTDTDVDLLEASLDANLEDSPHGRDFFIRKALGWALRAYASTDAGWVQDYVASRQDRLSGLSRREALKHL